MSVTRGLCAMHYKRWQLWGDPSAATRRAAALALSALLVACATPAPAEPVVCTTPDDMVLMPRAIRDDVVHDLKDLDEALNSCVKNLSKCRVQNNCS